MPNRKFSIDPDRLRRFLREAQHDHLLRFALNEDRQEARKLLGWARGQSARMRSEPNASPAQIEQADAYVAEVQDGLTHLDREIGALSPSIRQLAGSIREYAKANKVELPVEERLR